MYDMKKAEERILEYCAERAREDAVPPEDIACALMNEPGVLRMHGPEHHGIVPCVLLTACANCGLELDLPAALAEAWARGKRLPRWGLGQDPLL